MRRHVVGPGAAPLGSRVPTQSELAVRVTDNQSRIFVIASVVVFAGILAFGAAGRTWRRADAETNAHAGAVADRLAIRGAVRGAVRVGGPVGIRRRERGSVSERGPVRGAVRVAVLT